MPTISAAIGPIIRPAANPAGAGSGSAVPADVMFERIQALNPPLSVACRFNKVSATEFRLYRPMTSEGYWKEVVMRDGGVAGGPLCWNETSIKRVMTFITAANPACTYTGTWSNLGTSNPNNYTGGLGKQGDNGNSSEFVDIAFTGPGDLYVVYTGRTLGAYFRVEVDGSTNNATELPSNGTYRYIDTYSAVDNLYKQVVLVARNLSSGAHTVRLICTGDRNPANTSGFRQVFEAIALVGAGSLPGTAGTDLPAWQATTAYAQFAQIVTSAGRYYSCTVAGTSSSTEPTHTSGTATDGTVTWAFMASSSYDVGKHTIQVAGSELEYAYRVKPDTATNFAEAGGILHGNEQATAISVSVDGAPGVANASIPVGQWYSGNTIVVNQTIKTVHPETSTTDICQSIKSLQVTADEVVVTHQHTWNVAAQVGWFYSAMWPLLNWGATDNRYGMTRLWTQKSGSDQASSYYGQSNPIVGKKADYLMAASGDVLMPKGSGGAPSASPAIKKAAAALYVTAASVNNYDETTTRAGKAMNIAGTTAPGVSSVVMKMYMARNDSTAPVAVAPAQVWSCEGHYALSLVALNAQLPF